METIFTVGILKNETLFKIFDCYGYAVLTLDAHINVLSARLLDRRLQAALHIEKGKRVIKLLNVDFLNWEDAGGMELQWPGRVREFVMMATRVFNGDVHKTIIVLDTTEYLEFENMNVQEILNSTLNSMIWLSCRFTVPNLDALRRIRLARIESMWLRIETSCTTFEDGGLEILTEWLNKRSILCLRLLFPQEMKDTIIIPTFKAIYKRRWVCIELVAFSRLNHATAHNNLPAFDPSASWKMSYKARKKKFICPIFIFDDRTGVDFTSIDISVYDNASSDNESSPEDEPTIIELKTSKNYEENRQTHTDTENHLEESELSITEEPSTTNEPQDDKLLDLYGHQIVRDLSIGEFDPGDEIQPISNIKLDIDLPLFDELTRTEPIIEDFLT